MNMASNQRIEINAKALDFTLVDTQGKLVSLSSYQGKQNVLLVFNRGFA